MKYGIVSLNIYQKDNNWGSILQSWALQQVLNEINIDSYIVDYKPLLISKNTAKYPVLYNFPIRLKKFMFIHETINFYQRDVKFRNFIQNNYRVSSRCTKDNIGDLDVDGFIAGSDIIWHDIFWKGIEPAYFCDLKGMREKNNMAYAPSLSTNGFTSDTEQHLHRLLENFSYISVREKTKEHYVQAYTDKKVETVLDPTLLLTRTQYECITAKRLVDQPYVLVYCVGQNYRLIDHAATYAAKNKKLLVTIKCVPGVRYRKKGAICFDNAGIEEWLSLIKYADMIFTTSFHACIFSIIFEKQFYAVYAEFGKEKIINLLNNLNLQNYCDEKMLSYGNEANIDYRTVHDLLEEGKKHSLQFLEQLK